MSKRGLDLGDHRSRNVDERLMEKADLVLVMTRNHVEALSAAFPELAHKVHLLSHMIGETYDISDPYGGSPAEYSRTARELEGLIREGYERIVSLAETACEG
jgi:protein-tyrosine phosphatase